MIKDNAASLYWECPRSPDRLKPRAIPSTLPELWFHYTASQAGSAASQHASPSHGASWHVPMVAVWDSPFPHPFVLPTFLHHPPVCIPGCPGAAELPAPTAQPVTPSLEQPLPLTPCLSITRQPRCDRAIVGRGTLRAGVLHPR